MYCTGITVLQTNLCDHEEEIKNTDRHEAMKAEPRCYKPFFQLNPAEHDILAAIQS